MSNIEEHASLTTTIQQWEDAVKLFTNAAQSFCGLSASLESQCAAVNYTSADLIARIDSSLRSLQITLDQLTCARLTLAHTRTRLGSIVRLPDEVLSEIFIHYVYGPSDNNIVDTMQRRIEYIYQRVYTLLGVCTNWHRIGLECRDLWTVVPLVGHVTSDAPRIPSTELSLRRAKNQGLCLAISTDQFPQQWLDTLAGHWYRFSVVNIWSNSDESGELIEIMGTILKHFPSGSISNLSLRKKDQFPFLFYDYTFMNLEPEFSRLVSSLSVFRISNITMNWSRINFSRRLVELRVADIMLRDNSEVADFFVALSSAHQLKELKLISVEFDPSLIDDTVSIKVVSLPKLELLHLERLFYNVLGFVLSSISRGSYHLTLNLNTEICHNSPYDHWDDDNTVDPDHLYALLRDATVDKLILCGDSDFFREPAAILQRVLESVPGLRTLILNSFTLNTGLLKALERPLQSESSQHNVNFPRLTRLEIHRAFIAASLLDLKPGFRYVFDSHQLQEFVLGGTLGSGPWTSNGVCIDKSDETLEWMRRNVLRFTLSCEPNRAPEAIDMWQLWGV